MKLRLMKVTERGGKYCVVLPGLSPEKNVINNEKMNINVVLVVQDQRGELLEELLLPREPHSAGQRAVVHGAGGGEGERALVQNQQRGGRGHR